MSLPEQNAPVELASAVAEGYYSIGAAARASGISIRMIRYYESRALVTPVHRSSSNYRLYSEADINQLRFIRRARDLGFSMEQIEQLVSLWRNNCRSSAEVKKLTLEHVSELERKIAEMEEMKAALLGLATRCSGDTRPVCPILESLASPPAASHPAKQ